MRFFLLINHIDSLYSTMNPELLDEMVETCIATDTLDQAIDLLNEGILVYLKELADILKKLAVLEPMMCIDIQRSHIEALNDLTAYGVKKLSNEFKTRVTPEQAHIIQHLNWCVTKKKDIVLGNPPPESDPLPTAPPTEI
jgi:hypothetical protein